MTVAFYMLSLAGAIGAFDVFYYHMWTCRLFERKESAAENVTHAIRALLFSVFFTVIMHVDARGSWWWLYVVVCAAEMLNSMLDTYLEKSSRADQGGLPNGEYCLHVVLSVLIGGVMVAMVSSAWAQSGEPTSIAWRPSTLPPMFALTGHLSIGMGILFFLFESSSVVRVLRKRPTTREAGLEPA